MPPSCIHVSGLSRVASSHAAAAAAAAGVVAAGDDMHIM
jgi:hypothetical protein